MSLTDKLFEALKSSVAVNERITSLASSLDRMDKDIRNLDRRVVRIETLVEVSQAASSQRIIQ